MRHPAQKEAARDVGPEVEIRTGDVTLAGKKKLEVVPGATHLFEEEGKLERVAELARDWFLEHLGLHRGD